MVFRLIRLNLINLMILLLGSITLADSQRYQNCDYEEVKLRTLTLPRECGSAKVKFGLYQENNKFQILVCIPEFKVNNRDIGDQTYQPTTLILSAEKDDVKKNTLKNLNKLAVNGRKTFINYSFLEQGRTIEIRPLGNSNQQIKDTTQKTNYLDHSYCHFQIINLNKPNAHAAIAYPTKLKDAVQLSSKNYFESPFIELNKSNSPYEGSQ